MNYVTTTHKQEREQQQQHNNRFRVIVVFEMFFFPSFVWTCEFEFKHEFCFLDKKKTNENKTECFRKNQLK